MTPCTAETEIAERAAGLQRGQQHETFDHAVVALVIEGQRGGAAEAQRFAIVLAATVAIAEKFNSETTEQVGHRFGRIGTIDLRTDYLSQGIGKKFTATGRVTRLGGRIASVQMTLENETGQLIATGCASYVVS